MCKQECCFKILHLASSKILKLKLANMCNSLGVTFGDQLQNIIISFLSLTFVFFYQSDFYFFFKFGLI